MFAMTNGALPYTYIHFHVPVGTISSGALSSHRACTQRAINTTAPTSHSTTAPSTTAFDYTIHLKYTPYTQLQQTSTTAFDYINSLHQETLLPHWQKAGRKAM